MKSFIITQLLKFSSLDVLLYPTFTYLPAALETKQTFCSNNRLAASTGLPAITVPAGWQSVAADMELPVGMEMVGRPYSECTLLGIADAYMKHIGSAELRFPELD